jgi:arylsulfatase A-like enzyme
MPIAEASDSNVMIRGACFGARAAALFAAAEVLASTLVPALDPGAIPASPVGVGGFVLLGGVWILAGAIAGALIGWLAGARSREACTDGRLAAFATLVPVAAVIAHAIAVTPPVSRLAVLLVGGGVALGLLLARGLGVSGRALDSAASPWTLSLYLIALSVGVLDFERHTGALRQAGVALALAVVVFGVAAATGFAVERIRFLTPPAGRARAASGLVAAILTWLFATGLGSLAEGGRRPELPPPRASGGEHRPSVLLITLDTVRSDHLSLYGYERNTSPRLADFARQATVYTRSIAASDLTLSTHASIFTGLYALQHGARVEPTQGAAGLGDGFRTLAEVLSDAGYLSVGVVANPSYLARRYGVAQGFAHYDDRYPAPRVPELPSHLPGRSIGRGLRALGVGGEAFVRAFDSYRIAEVMNREVFGLLDELAARPDPFFLFVNYMDAHWPYDPPPPYDVRFAGGLDRNEPLPGTETFRAARQLKAAPSEAQRRHMLSRYDGEIAYLDSELGRLFDRLDALGLLERILVVITADHGEAFGEHGLYAHGVSVYQNQVHVPLVIRRPGQTAGRVSDRWVSSVDLLPTVLDAVGLPVPQRLAGRRLAGVSLVGDGSEAERMVMSESYPDTALVVASPRFRRIERAVFAGDEKLIASSEGPRQLYDLRLDPAEQHDRHSVARATRLERALVEWLDDSPGRPGAAPPMDEALRRRLHALGYAR